MAQGEASFPIVLMPQLSLSFTVPSHLRVCVDFWCPTENFCPLSASVLLQIKEVAFKTFSGSGFACATSCQDEQGSSCAFCCPACVVLHTWLLCHVALFCGEGPKPPFLNGGMCYQLLGKGRRVPLSVKTQSSSCDRNRLRVFQNPTTLELWTFHFWIKPFK